MFPESEVPAVPAASWPPPPSPAEQYRTMADELLADANKPAIAQWEREHATMNALRSIAASQLAIAHQLESLTAKVDGQLEILAEVNK